VVNANQWLLDRILLYGATEMSDREDPNIDGMARSISRRWAQMMVTVVTGAILNAQSCGL
jgi:hypothetical protein